MEHVAKEVRLSKGSILFQEGDPGDGMYIIRQGEVEISVLSESGRKLALNIMGPEEVLGEIGLFGGDRTATATALSDCVLASIRRPEVLAELKTNPDLALEFINLLSERLRYVSAQLGERTFLPLSARLARRLLYLDGKVGEKSGSVPVSQADLADFVGTTRESVAKTLSVWKLNGWVAISRGKVNLLNMDALEELAEQLPD